MKRLLFSLILFLLPLTAFAQGQQFGPGQGGGGGVTFANPTGTIGTSAVNGSATTAMRSDAAPAIPQCSSSTFGACEVDGSSIAATSGVITASFPAGFNTIDATKSSGADMCAKISAAATTLQTTAPGGGTIDARGFSGTQACAGNMFASWPASPFFAQVRLGCSVTVVTAVTIVIPSFNGLSGTCPYNDNNGPGGTIIQAGNSFPTESATVTISNANPAVISLTAHGLTVGQGVSFSTTGSLPNGLTASANGLQTEYYIISAGFGANSFEVSTTPGGTAVATSSAGSGTQTLNTITPLIQMGPGPGAAFGIEVKKLSLVCRFPNTTTPVGAVGLENLYSQEQTHVEHILIRGCQDGVVIAGQIGDGNDYEHIDVSDNPGPGGANWHCLRVGDPSISTQDNGVMDINYFECNTTGTVATNKIMLDGVGYSLRHLYEENDGSAGTTNFINIGAQTGAAGAGQIELLDVVCDGSTTVSAGSNCIKNTFGFTVFSVMNVTAQPTTNTNIINDTGAGGCVVSSGSSGATENALGYYSRGVARAVLTTSSVCGPKLTRINTSTALSAPALTSCGTGSPAITGTDMAGQVTMGTSAAGCTITFNTAYTNTPFCTVTWQGTPLASQQYTLSNSAIVLTQTSTSGNKVNYTCMGNVN